MTANECSENRMASESHHGAVVRVGDEVVVVVLGEAIIEVGGVFVEVDRFDIVGGQHAAKIPKFHGLVFAIRQDITAITFGIDIG